MRRLSFDEYEFDDLSSEESLTMAISSTVHHQDLTAFLTECGATRPPASLPSEGWGRWCEVVDYTLRFAGLHLPPLPACRVSLLSDDWNDLELVVETGSLFGWDHWWTTA
jgi:hypothetical protein